VCRIGAALLTDDEIEQFRTQVPDWKIEDVDGCRRLVRLFKFDDFAGALEFANRVGQIAEAEGHHPNIEIRWGAARVSWWTHKIKGLHRNDFIMAARTDMLVNKGES
jgi:4a-hydroxytetrahydrobiopterin dehydratase